MDLPRGTCSDLNYELDASTSADSPLTTLVDLLRARRAATPGKELFRFVLGDGQAAEVLRYDDLDRRARAIGAKLARDYEVGSRALLLFAPGLDFVEAYFGCLYGGLVPVPAALPSRKSRAGTLELLTRDAQPAAVLTSERDEELIRRLGDAAPSLHALDMWAVDQISDEAAASWRMPAVSSRSLALLQYTSGSTSNPRGVMVTHENLMVNSALIQQAFGTSPESRGVFWLPLFHDMGLIGGMLQTVYCGGSSVLMAPAAFLHRPRLWLEMISETQATISGGPNFAYEQCVRRIPESERQGLDLRSWQVAFTGAEPIRADTLDRFCDAFASCGFQRRALLACYGLAEATLLVTSASADHEPRTLDVEASELENHRAVPRQASSASSSNMRSLVSCGRWRVGQHVHVVATDGTRLCQEGEVGEIWVGGASIAQGYWNQPSASQETFGGRLPGTGDGPYLRTGDLGFLLDGELYVTGRKKDLVIIRGRNFYPQDIERSVEQAHPAFRRDHCAVFTVGPHDDQLVVVQEIEPRWRDLDAEPAFQAIRQAVAREHELEVFGIALLSAGALPRTSSGKIRRRTCRAAYLARELEIIADWAAETPKVDMQAAADPLPARGERAPTALEVQTWLVHRLSERLNVPVSQISVHTPFVDFAMSSLDAVEITADLERWLGRRLSPTVIYNYPTVSALAAWLARPAPGNNGHNSPSITSQPLEQSASLMEELQELSDAELEALVQAEMSKHRA